MTAALTNTEILVSHLIVSENPVETYKNAYNGSLIDLKAIIDVCGTEDIISFSKTLDLIFRFTDEQLLSSPDKQKYEKLAFHCVRGLYVLPLKFFDLPETKALMRSHVTSFLVWFIHLANVAIESRLSCPAAFNGHCYHLCNSLLPFYLDAQSRTEVINNRSALEKIALFWTHEEFSILNTSWDTAAATRVFSWSLNNEFGGSEWRISLLCDIVPGGAPRVAEIAMARLHSIYSTAKEDQSARTIKTLGVNCAMVEVLSRFSSGTCELPTRRELLRLGASSILCKAATLSTRPYSTNKSLDHFTAIVFHFIDFIGYLFLDSDCIERAIDLVDAGLLDIISRIDPEAGNLHKLQYILTTSLPKCLVCRSVVRSCVKALKKIPVGGKLSVNKSPLLAEGWNKLLKLVHERELLDASMAFRGPEIIYCAREECLADDNVTDLKRCSGCEQVFYCTARCQNEDWKQHRAYCKEMRSVPNFRKRDKAFIFSLGRRDAVRHLPLLRSLKRARFPVHPAQSLMVVVDYTQVPCQLFLEEETSPQRHTNFLQYCRAALTQETHINIRTNRGIASNFYVPHFWEADQDLRGGGREKGVALPTDGPYERRVVRDGVLFDELDEYALEAEKLPKELDLQERIRMVYARRSAT